MRSILATKKPMVTEVWDVLGRFVIIRSRFNRSIPVIAEFCIIYILINTLADRVAELNKSLGKLEENGMDISGGEWQRVAVARACLPDSAFVILDEPTASLDPVAENNMYHSFSEVLKNRGCIMISHRLASTKMADKIVVLSDGVVTETGNHNELLSAGALYSLMYKCQSAWYSTLPEGGEAV